MFVLRSNFRSPVRVSVRAVGEQRSRWLKVGSNPLERAAILDPAIPVVIDPPDRRWSEYPANLYVLPTPACYRLTARWKGGSAEATFRIVS